MPTITPEILEKAIQEAGMTPAGLATAIGRDKDYIRDYLVGRKRSLKADDLVKIQQKIGRHVNQETPFQEIADLSVLPQLPVIGTIRAGAWIETYMLEHEDQGTVPVSIDSRFPHARQYALAVSGDSMDKLAPDGSFAICVDFAESGLRLKAGMIAHVEATEHDKAESTLKEVGFEGNEVILIPRSSNPVYRATKLRGHDGVEVRVKGIMLSVYNPQRW